MSAKLRDLVNIAEAAELHKLDLHVLLFDALDSKLALLSISKKDTTVELLPCRKEWIEEECFFIDSYDRSKVEFVEVALGQVLELSEMAIKSLIVNRSFSEVELYRNLGVSVEDTEFDYKRTAEELYLVEGWVDGKPNYLEMGLDQVFLLKSQLEQFTSTANNPSAKRDVSSNTSLKVIGLLMHHLAKSPKYASGSTPNKSQIKELLMDLAQELDVNKYGLSKVDERLLAEAMKYLENQKN